MNSDFEYITYLDDEWPAAYENEGVEVPPRVARPAASRTGAARPGMARRAAAHPGAQRPRGFPGGFPGAAIPPDGFGDDELPEEELPEEEPPEEEPPGGWRSASRRADAGGRTEVLITQGRSTAGKRRMARGRLGRRRAGDRMLTRRNVMIAAAATSVLAIVLAVVLHGGSASWPSSVATVKQQVDVACQNPNVASEPGQVNFACAQDSRPILWVFALLTSGDEPGFADAATGRKGLEPIAPAQGGAVAFSLNLHHPYNAASPLDSLAVAARAINSIIAGATVTTQNGGQVVQPGLESSAGNCQRYTGSAALITRQGFPALCAKPVTSAAGQAALVSDVYKQWMVGAPSREASNAAVLYQNSDNPGDPRVQAILRDLAQAGQ
jgi:hypothetical protein